MKNVISSGDYTSSFNPFVFAAVPENLKCLDVGCWSGNLGKELIRKKNCVVDGVDVNKNVLKTAKRVGYNKVFLMNLNNDDTDLTKFNNKYDVIILADILEHLIDPQTVLSKFKKNLTKDGIIIISLPNIAFILNRFLLLFGKWDYREFGTLDKTHLRFFTIKTLKSMVKSAGFKIIKVKPYNQFGILKKLNLITSLLPQLFSYQILLIAKKQ